MPPRSLSAPAPSLSPVEPEGTGTISSRRGGGRRVKSKAHASCRVHYGGVSRGGAGERGFVCRERFRRRGPAGLVRERYSGERSLHALEARPQRGGHRLLPRRETERSPTSGRSLCAVRPGLAARSPESGFPLSAGNVESAV